jgi:uncharacterized damage-inducible protein DinB
MISTDYIRTMAAYNRWQNGSLYGAADTLSDAERKQERGAFFGSIHGTLNHLLWGDRIWLSRFGAGEPPPKVSALAQTVDFHAEWQALCAARQECDGVITAWAEAVDPAWLEGEMTWHSPSQGREVSKPHWLLVTHMFNHQTHHRGQVHAMLTAAGARPDDTDIPFMPPAL